MKKFCLLAVLLAGATLAPHQAYAVTDEEFKQMQAQMAALSAKLDQFSDSQKKLEAENAALKQQNAKLTQSNDKLATRVDTVTQRTEQLAAANAAQVAAIAPAAPAPGGVPPVAGAAVPEPPKLQPGEFMLPGTDTTMKIGGYVKVDAIHDANVSRVGGGEDFASFSTIPLEDSAEDQKNGNTRLHARQTRLNLTATTPSEYGNFKVFLEGDFFAEAGSQNTTNAENFGLRHAYGEVGNFLAGQTWSTFMDMDAYPETLDYVGPTGITLLRQAQVRYTFKPDGTQNAYAIALESPNSDFSSNPANPGVDTNVNQFPDVVASAKWGGDLGELSAKGVLRQLGAYDTVTNSEDEDTGYGLGLSGKLKVGEKDDLRFQVAYGDGIGRYIYDVAATGGGGAGYTAVGDELEAIDAWGGYLAFRHVFSDKVRGNLIAGATQITGNPDFLPEDSTNEKLYSGEANLFWAVTPKIDLGAGYIYGHREVESGLEGELHRVQATAIYKF